VLQSELPELELLDGGEIGEKTWEQVWSVKTRLGLPLESEEYAAFVRKQCRAFFSIESWIRYARTRDLFVGTRFHGNVVAALHGVPALMFAHDSRTTEMCDWIRLPYSPLDPAPLDDLERLYAETDFSGFVSRHAELYAAYREFMAANGVPHNLS
jgi:hypothetical protein